MLPLYLGSLWAVYRIGRALRSERVALWGTAIAAVMPKDETTAVSTDTLVWRSVLSSAETALR